MKEEALHPWIEPELEARIIALVLGEASDFESEELEHLIKERAELALFRKRTESLHGLLQEIATGESADDNDDWKLSDEKRKAVLAVIDGQAEEKLLVSVSTETITKSKGRRGNFFKNIIQIAAVLFVVALIAGMMMPSFKRVIGPAGYKLAAASMSEASDEAYFGDVASSNSIQPPPADLSSIPKPDHQAESRSSLSSIQDSLGRYTAVTSEQELDSGLVVGYNTSHNFKGGSNKNDLSFPDMNDKPAAPRPALAVSSAASTIAIPDDVNINDIDGAVVPMSAGFGMSMKTPASAADPFGSGGGGRAATDPFASADDGAAMAAKLPAEKNNFARLGEREIYNQAANRGFETNDNPSQANMARGKSSTFGDARLAARKPQAPGNASDKIHMGHGQVVPITGMLAKAKTEQGATIAGGTFGAEIAASEQMPVAGKKEASKAGETPVSAGRVSARSQIQVAGAQKMAKTKAKKNVDTFAANAPAKSAPAPAAAPMPAIQEELVEAEGNNGTLYANAGRGQGAISSTYSSAARSQTRAEFLRRVAAGWELPVPNPNKTTAGVDVSANQKTQDRVSRRDLAFTDSSQEADEDVAMEMVARKKVMNKEGRSNRLHELKSRAELKAPKQTLGREMITSNRSRQSLVKEDSIDSLVDGKKMSQDIKGNKDAAQFDNKERLARNKSEETSYITMSPQAVLKNRIMSITSKIIPAKKTEQEQDFAVASDSINGLISQTQPKSVVPKLIPIKKSTPPTGLNEKNADDEAFSTFSLHVSDVSFKLAQAALSKGEWPDASKIRIEEFVNAFDYGDPMPNQNEKVASQMEQSIHPFLQQRNLLRVSMRTAAAGRSANTPLRLTFLLDNSGSMERSDRRETVQRAFALLAQQLQPMDQVTLISFARQPRLLADKVSGSKSKQLVQLVSNIPSEGGTNLEAALQLAFEKAREQQVDNAQNRIIMLTDGAANLGNANPENLSKMIESMRDAGIAFDAAGIGADGLNDEILEALTRKGDGRYYLLDQPEDADEGFARQIAGALRPAAKNVKVQVEFNPKRVGKYKLLGFEKHRLKKEDFRNDKVDAAEMAAAEAGVALYQFEAKPDGEGDVGSVSVRFRDMSTGQMVENRWPIPYQADAPRIDQAAPSLQIASSAALLAAKLKGGPLAASVDLKTLSNLINGLPERHRSSKRIQQLQQMINVARDSSP